MLIISILRQRAFIKNIIFLIVIISAFIVGISSLFAGGVFSRPVSCDDEYMTTALHSIIKNEQVKTECKRIKKADGAGIYYESLANIICQDRERKENKWGYTNDADVWNDAVFLWWHSKTALGLYNAGVAIHERNFKIKEGNPDEIAACFYRSAATPEAWTQLAILIQTGSIDEDELGNKIAEGAHYRVAARIYRRAKTPKALINLGILIHLGLTNKDERGRVFTEVVRYHIAANLYRRFLTPTTLANLGNLIRDRFIDKDELGKKIAEGAHYRVAARIYRRAGTPETLAILGDLIRYRFIDKDELGKKIAEGAHYRVAARIYRLAKTPEALNSLANLIEERSIDEDERGEKIAEGKHYHVAARLYRLAAIPIAWVNFARLIGMKSIDEDELGKKIAEGAHYRVAARIYRSLKTPEALNSLGILMFYEESIDVDENERKITSAERNTVLLRLIKAHDSARSLYHMGIIYASNERTYTEAVNCFSLSFERGESYAGSRLIDMQQKIDEIEKKKSKEEGKEEGKEKVEDPIILQKVAKRKKDRAAFSKLLKGDPLLSLEKQSLVTQNDYSEKEIKWSKEGFKQYMMSPFKKRINQLIESIQDGTSLGRPETLTGSDAISRRITEKDRLVYKLSSTTLEITQCADHY
jgi:Txe/YoeB family toxin of Txe-Axe toxin-antitoxin module